MSRQFYKIEFKATPKARKILSVNQTHETIDDARAIKLVRQEWPEAVLVAARALTDAEAASVRSGWAV